MIEFKSDMFPAFPEEDSIINPGCYGKRLAEFLADRLAQRGIMTGSPIAEDWGWMIGITDTRHVWIGCSNIDGEPGRFSIFIEPSRGYVHKWFKKISVRTITDSLKSKILDILQEENGISEIELILPSKSQF